MCPRPKPTRTDPVAMGRETSDEAYVLDLADCVLGQQGQRQHRFEFLRGDPSPKRPNGTCLPVDAFYENLDLVIEYRERQHVEDVPFFDDRDTVSGVPRGVQRRSYDLRRETVLPEYGIECEVIGYQDLAHDSRRRLLRNREDDLSVLGTRLAKYRDGRSRT